MQSDKRLILMASGLAIIAVGGLAGLALGNDVASQARSPEVAETVTDPVERYELGRNAYAPPKVKARPSYAPEPANQNYEYGRRVNGKRVLVPAEPAIKKEREQLMKEQQEFNNWQAESFGHTAIKDPDFHAFDQLEVDTSVPAEE